MMKMISLVFFTTFLLPATAIAARSPSAPMYEFVARGAHRRLPDESESPALISFDGDLDAIAALALEKANAGANGGGVAGEDGDTSPSSR